MQSAWSAERERGVVRCKCFKYLKEREKGEGGGGGRGGLCFCKHWKCGEKDSEGVCGRARNESHAHTGSSHVRQTGASSDQAGRANRSAANKRTCCSVLLCAAMCCCVLLCAAATTVSTPTRTSSAPKRLSKRARVPVRVCVVPPPRVSGAFKGGWVCTLSALERERAARCVIYIFIYVNIHV